MQVGGAGHDAERRGRHAAVGEDLLGASLVKREPEGERVAARVRDLQVLADRRDVRLAARTARPLGNVEDDVGAGEGETVLIVQGSSARFTEQTKKLPVDATIIGIVDQVSVGGASVFKSGT